LQPDRGKTGLARDQVDSLTNFPSKLIGRLFKITWSFLQKKSPNQISDDCKTNEKNSFDFVKNMKNSFEENRKFSYYYLSNLEA
jgi:hypothetical protein